MPGRYGEIRGPLGENLLAGAPRQAEQ